MSSSCSFTCSDFNVTTCLSDCSLYLRLVNNTTFQSYESNVNINDIETPFNNIETYDIMCKCFQNKQNYQTNFNIKPSGLMITFNILIDNIYKLSFNIIVKEKILNGDAQVSLNISRLETKHKEDIKKLENKNKELENKIMKLENIVDKIGSIPVDMKNNTFFYTYNSIEFIDNNANYPIKYELLKYFYCLKKIKLTNLYSDCIARKNIIFQNSSVEILIFSIMPGERGITSLHGLHNLPSVHTLEFHNCTELTEASQIISYLHKNIKKISFFSCGSTTKDLLSKYCLDNSIDLQYF